MMPVAAGARDTNTVAANSIVGRHWFGHGTVSLNEPEHRVRLQRLIGHLHSLGPRPVGEFLIEILAAWPVPADDVLERLERYGRLDPDVVHALGADRFPPMPLQVVARRAANGGSDAIPY